jgi:hypothetical protein
MGGNHGPSSPPHHHQQSSASCLGYAAARLSCEPNCSPLQFPHVAAHREKADQGQKDRKGLLVAR